MSQFLVRLAALATTLFAIISSAHAQPSVRLYGVLDVGVGSVEPSGGTRSTQVTSGGLTTSFWGLNGKEDLGAGLEAQFSLESYLRVDSGEPARFRGDGFFSRASHVGLAGNFGALRLGRIGTPLFTTTFLYNPLGSSFGFSPVVQNLFGATTGKVAGDTAWDNAIGYFSPSVGGFSGSALYALKESSRGSNAGAGVNYAAGSFGAGVSWQDVKTAFKTGEERTRQVGAFYDFSVVKVFGQFASVHENATSTAAANTGDRIKQLGVSAPVGLATVFASWSRARTTGVGRSSRAFTTVGYDHRLSRRTDLYAMLMRDKFDARPRGITWGVGLRQSF